MPDPEPPTTQAAEAGPGEADQERRALIDVLDGLRAGAPEGCRRVDLAARMLVSAYESEIFYTLADGTTVPGPVDDPEIARRLQSHREVYYRTHGRTWYSLRMCLPDDDEFSSGANYRWEPLWREAVPTAKYQEDLGRFPIPHERAPYWLRAKFAG